MKTNLKEHGGKLVVAVDFDGTLVKHEWPEIGPMMKNADVVMRRLYYAGHKLIIWTARSGDSAVNAAKAWLHEKGIPYHGFNELPEPQRSMYGPLRGAKLHADCFIDDHSLHGLPEDWEEIYDLLVSVHNIPRTGP